MPICTLSVPFYLIITVIIPTFQLRIHVQAHMKTVLIVEVNTSCLRFPNLHDSGKPFFSE